MRRALKRAVSFVLVLMIVFSIFTILPSEVFHTAYVNAAENISSALATYAEAVNSSVQSEDSTGETSETEAQDNHTHKYVLTSSSEPTCTEKGVDTFTCTICGDSYTDTGKEVLLDRSRYFESDHNYSNNFSKTWDFSEKGAEYILFTLSEESLLENGFDHLYFYNRKGVLVADLTGNISNKTVKVPGDTCSVRFTTDGSVVYYGFSFSSIKARIEYNAKGHNYVETSYQEPTCTEKGVKTYTCETCGETYKDTGYDTLIDSSRYPQSEHNYSNNMDQTWHFTQKGADHLDLVFYEDCWLENNHDYLYIYDSEGNQVARYNGTFGNQKLTVLGDSFTARLTSDGSAVGYGFSFASITARYEYYPTGHSYELISSVAPTCTENGMGTYKCSVCGDIYTDNGEDTLMDSSEYPESAHEYSNYMDKTWVVSHPGTSHYVLKFSSQCYLESGYDYLYIYDSKNNLIGKYNGYFAGQTVRIDDSSFKIRMTTDHSVTYYGFSFESIYVSGPHGATGHSFTKYESEKGSNCTVEGTATAKCDNGCGATDTRSNAAIGHSFTKYVSDGNATCVLNGTQTAECDNGCGAKNTIIEPAKGHMWDDGVKTSDPTCSKMGTIVYTCATCGTTRTEYIDTVEHQYEETYVKETCTSNAYYKYECVNCKKSFEINDGRLLSEDSYPKSEHNYENNSEKTWEYSYDGAKQLVLKFSDKSSTELNHDYIYIYDKTGKQAGVFSGCLAGESCVVDGDSFSVKLVSDEKTTDYGFEFESITAKLDLDKATGHKYTVTSDGDAANTKHYVCDYCGYSYEKADPPAAISNVVITPSETSISVSWQISTEYDTTIYRVYRKAENEGDFTRIAQINGRDNTKYTDTDVQFGKVYSYYVVGVDKYKQESETYEVVSATLKPDVDAPQFISMSPSSNSVISRVTTFNVSAQDNVGVTKAEFYYSVDPEAPIESWHMLNSDNGGILSQNINTSVIPDGYVFVKVKLYDAAGNSSYSTAYRYLSDNTGPEKIKNVKCIAIDGTTATLSWDDVSDKDISHFVVEYKDSDGNWSTAAVVNSTLGLNLSGLTPETSYTYRVVGYDIYGNRGTESDEITITTLKDTITPKVTRMTPAPGYFKSSISMQFTATDDHRVVSLDVQTSADKKNWDTVAHLDSDSQSSSCTFSYTLDVSKYDEGSLYVRGIATDSYGNKTADDEATCYEYEVDRTAPSVPTGVTANSAEADNQSSFVCIAWDAITGDSSFSHYRVYRSDEEDGDYTLVKDNLNTVNTYDTNVEYGATYYYKVDSVDLAGNVSEKSAAVVCKVKDDTEPPVILPISPAEGTKIGNNNNSITVAAADNAMVKNLKVEYRTNALISPYKTLKEVTNNTKNNCSVTVSLPLDEISSGTEVIVKVTASDSAGNEAEKSTVTYLIDKDAPQVNDISLSKTDDNIFTTKWSTDADDVTYFYVYRKRSADSSFVLYDSVMAVSGKKSYSYTDDEITVADKNVQYRIESHDEAGNTAFADTDVVSVSGTIKPVAMLDCQSTVVCGSEYMFDGSVSTDDGKIESYSFDFGDGTDAVTSTTGKVKHIYADKGKYTLKLRVTDDDGNIGEMTKVITVTGRELVGNVYVTVKDDKGNVLPGTDVYADLGEEGQQHAYADSYGRASFELPVGTHVIASYKNSNYLPVKQNVAVTGGDMQLTLILVNEPIVTGEFEIHKMTFDEIVAAGIDINAAENRNVVRIDVTLVYEKMPIKTEIYWNGVNAVAEPVYVKSSNGTTRKLTPYVFGGSGYSGSSGGGGSYESIETPTIVYIDVPVEFSYLKEFFSVSLHIINHASEDFSLLNNTIKLNVPDGLSVVETNSSESKANVYVDEIKGQTQKTINWVLRGDKPGSYEISADYLGIISYFNEPVSAKFIAEDKIEVHDASAVNVEVEAAQTSYGGRVFYNTVIKNEGDFALDAFKWTPLIESYYDEYVQADGTRSEMEDQVTTLNPGEKFIYHYFTETGDMYRYIGNMVNDLNSFGAQVNVTIHEPQYFLEAFYEKFPEESGAFVLEVTDRQGNSVTNATVEFSAGTTYQTDEKGRVIIEEEDRDKVNCEYLKVTADGYYSYFDRDFKSVKFGKSNGVTLYREGEYAVDSVLVNGKDATKYSTSIQTNKTDSDDNPVSVTVTSKIYGNVKSVDVVQNGKVLKSLSSGHSELEHTYTATYSAADFTEKEQVVLRVTENSGEQHTEKLKINAVKFDLNPTLDLPDSINVSLKDSSLDWLSDFDFDINFSENTNVTQAFDPETQTVTFGINVGLGKDSNDYSLDTTYEDIIKEYEEALEETIKAGGFKDEILSGTAELELGFSIGGALVFNVNDDGSLGNIVKSKLYLGVGASCEYGTNFWVGYIPLTMTVGVTVDAKAETTFVYNDTTYMLGFDNFNLKLSIELELDLGIGISCCSFGAYGSVGASTEIVIDKSMYVDNFTVSGEFGFYVKFFFYEEKFPIFSGSKELYKHKSSKNQSLKSMMAVAYDADSYSANGNLLSYNSVWNKAIKASKQPTALLENAYSGSAPQFAVCGDKIVMVYQGADRSADSAANSLALYYSVYNASSDSWSVPSKLDDNQNSDMAFSLEVCNDNIYVVYTQSNKSLSNDMSMSDAFKNIDVYASIFDANSNSFGNTQRLSDNESYDSAPVIKNIGGVPTAIWINNAENEPFLKGDSNSIMISRYVDGNWTEAQTAVSNITSPINCNMLDSSNGGTIIYTMDSDGDFTTTSDRSIVSYDLSDGSAKTIESGVESDVETAEILGKDTVMWYKNGKLMQYDSESKQVSEAATVRSSLAKNFEIATDNNGNYALVYVENDNTVYAMYLNSENGNWQNPVKVASSNNNIENLAAEYIDGNLTLTYYDTEVTDMDTMETESSLVTVVSESASKPEITSADVNYDNLVNDEISEICVDVTNNGSNPTGDLTFNVLDYNNEVIGTYTSDGVSLASGESREFKIPFVVPSVIYNRDITVTVSDSENANLSSYKLSLAKADVTVLAEQYRMGTQDFIRATVKNNCCYATPATLEVYNKDTDEVLYTTEISSVIKGKPATLLIPLKADYIDSDGYVSVRVNSKSQDYRDFNNTDMFAYFGNNKFGNSDLVIGDVNRDGIINVSDVTLIQKYLSKDVELDDTQIELADINHDGLVTILDVTMIQCCLSSVTSKSGFCGKLYEDVKNLPLINPPQPSTSQPVSETVQETSETQPDTKPSGKLIGDIDMNGCVNIIDVTLLQGYINDTINLDDQALTAADVNRDGKVNIEDVSLIQKYLLSIEAENNYCGTYY